MSTSPDVWLSVKAANELHDRMKTFAPWARLLYEVHPGDANLARLSLIMSDSDTGNQVCRFIFEESVPSEVIADAKRELRQRGTQTRRRIRDENAPT